MSIAALRRAVNSAVAPAGPSPSVATVDVVARRLAGLAQSAAAEAKASSGTDPTARTEATTATSLHFVNVVTGESMRAGQPVHVHIASAKLMRSDSSVYAMTSVIGLCVTDTADGFAADVALKRLELSDWTSATGSAALTPGANYFLDSHPGKMTTTPPNTPGLSCVIVGVAASPTKMAIHPSTPILL